MRLLVNHKEGKIYINTVRYKHELRFECELQVQIRHFYVRKSALYFTHKSPEGQSKH